MMARLDESINVVMTSSNKQTNKQTKQPEPNEQQIHLEY
jgi:hypothetical protein